MSALPRPALPPGPQSDLVTELHDLHHRDGWRSLRTLARDTGVSHTTVSKAFSSSSLPSWGTLELLVEAMGGDIPRFHEMWLAASEPAQDDPASTMRIAGRRAELDAVRRHLRVGNGLLLVTGEAGMGKTTLMEAACHQVRGSVLAAVGHCLPLSADIPLLPFTEALRQVSRAEGQVLAGALQACPRYVREALSALLPELSADGDVPDPDDRWLRQRLFSAVAELIDALSGLQPFALVLEDLHWADDLTLDLVEHLVRSARARILGTWRIDDPEVPRERQEWCSRVRRDAMTLQLGPLTREETIEQLRLLVPSATMETAVRIHARSAGQPLFTEQLAHADAGRPSYLGDLLDGRVGHLAGEHWSVASVLGVADRPMVESDVALATSIEADRMVLVLRELQQRRLLVVSDGAVHLRHPLLAEAVRRRLLPTEAAAAHGALARVLGAADGAEPAEVARHWREADEPAEEFMWQVRAARSAAERYAGLQAAGHWLRVLALWPPGAAEAGDPPLRRHEVVAGIANQFDLAGRPREAVPVLDAELASPDAFTVPERADLLRQLARFNSSQFVTGSYGLQLVEQAIELYRTLPPSPGLAAALTWRGTELEWHGRRDEAISVLAEAADLAAITSDRLLERSARAQWAWQLAASGDSAAVDEIARVIREFGYGGNPMRDLVVAVRHSDILLMTCHPADAVADAARPALQLAAHWDLTTAHVQVLKANVSQARRRAGQVRQALQTLRGDTDLEETAPLPLLHVERSILEVLLGNKDAARRRLSLLVSGVHEVVDTFILEAHLQYEIWMGDPAEGLRMAETVLGSRHDEVSPGTAGDLLAMAARAAADAAVASSASDRRALARTLRDIRSGLHHDPFDSAAVLADRAARPQWEAETGRLLGDENVEAWLEAATAWDTIARPHDAAYCRWRAAQAALRDGQGTTAIRLLKRAAADAREHVPLREAIMFTQTTATAP